MVERICRKEEGESLPPRHIPSGVELLQTYCRTGHTSDYEQIVRRFAPVVFTECRRVTRNPHDAEDAAQLTFLALAMELKMGKEIRYPTAWLQRVAKHQAIKIVRSRGRRQKRENAVRKLDLHEPNEIALDGEHNSGIIRDEIDRLPNHYRMPLVLHYFGSMSLEMIASELKIGKQTVGTRLHRARKMLAEKLTAHGIELNSTLMASALSVVVPAAVVKAIVGSAAASTPTASQAVFPGAIAHLVQATAISGISRWMRVAALAMVVTFAGSAIGGAVMPGWSIIKKIQNGGAVEWFHKLLPSGVKPSLSSPIPSKIRESLRLSAASTGDASPVVASASAASVNAFPPSSIASPTILSASMPMSESLATNDRLVWSNLSWNSFQSLTANLSWDGWDAIQAQSVQVIQSSPVPEPAAAGMIGLAALFIRRRTINRR